MIAVFTGLSFDRFEQCTRDAFVLDLADTVHVIRDAGKLDRFERLCPPEEADAVLLDLFERLPEARIE